MHKLSGGCHCGNIYLGIDLSQEPGTYNPRVCDCDYCRKHGASYISDAHGSLLMRIADQSKLGTYRQGAGLAEFLLCTTCGVLVTVLYSRDARLYAAVNTKGRLRSAAIGLPENIVGATENGTLAGTLVLRHQHR